ncbi:MAG: dihydroneopterin aldolase [Lentimonas sp.]|jgi:dihydroneopterin aldolase
MIIKIKNLEIDTIVGVYDWESEHSRKLIFNAQMEVDDEKSMSSDDLKDTIDYDLITNQIKDYVGNNRCHLIEKMVGDILKLIMQEKRIVKCTLEIDKLKVYDFVDSFSVSKTITRDDSTN